MNKTAWIHRFCCRILRHDAATCPWKAAQEASKKEVEEKQ